jgi:hypothetical protein
VVTGSDAGLQQETKVRPGLLPADISKAAHGFTCPRKRNKSSRRIASSRDDGIVVLAARPRRDHGDPPLLMTLTCSISVTTTNRTPDTAQVPRGHGCFARGGGNELKAPHQRQRAPKKTAALRSGLRLTPHQVRCVEGSANSALREPWARVAPGHGRIN